MDLQSRDLITQKKVIELGIELLSYVKKKETISCPTPLPPLLVKKFPLQSYSGHFNLLPLESFWLIFHFSDLESLSIFRRLNRRARFLLDNWPVYSILLKHVPKVLLIFMRTGAASYFTAKQILDVLYVKECTVCGNFGSYLYLPQSKRCCFRCFESNIQLATITKEEVILTHSQALSKEAFEDIRFVSTTSEESSTRLLASYQEVYEKTIARDPRRRNTQMWMALSGKMEPDIRGRFCPSRFGLAREVMTLFPYLNSNTGRCEYAILCRGCSSPNKKTRIFGNQSKLELFTFWSWEMEYSEEGFIEHLRNCKAGQRIWNNVWNA